MGSRGTPYTLHPLLEIPSNRMRWSLSGIVYGMHSFSTYIPDWILFTPRSAKRSHLLRMMRVITMRNNVRGRGTRRIEISWNYDRFMIYHYISTTGLSLVSAIACASYHQHFVHSSSKRSDYRNINFSQFTSAPRAMQFECNFIKFSLLSKHFFDLCKSVQNNKSK